MEEGLQDKEGKFTKTSMSCSICLPTTTGQRMCVTRSGTTRAWFVALCYIWSVRRKCEVNRTTWYHGEDYLSTHVVICGTYCLNAKEVSISRPTTRPCPYHRQELLPGREMITSFVFLQYVLDSSTCVEWKSSPWYNVVKDYCVLTTCRPDVTQRTKPGPPGCRPRLL